MNRILLIVMLTVSLAVTGCGALRPMGLGGRRCCGEGVFANTRSRLLPPPGDFQVVRADYSEVAVGCGSCGEEGGCNRCQGEPQRWSDSKGRPFLKRVASALSCGSGCGEIYWGEWLSNPPKADPCDSCGNYTGSPNNMMFRPHRKPVRRMLSSLKGVRYDSSCQSCDTGCGDCGDCHQDAVPAASQPVIETPAGNAQGIPAPQPQAGKAAIQTSYRKTYVARPACATCRR